MQKPCWMWPLGHLPMLLAQSRGVDGWPWPRFRSVSPEVLELDLSLKTPGLQEVEKHSADIPAKFKPAAWQKEGVFVFFVGSNDNMVGYAGDFFSLKVRKKMTNGKCSDEIQMRRKWFWKALSCHTNCGCGFLESLGLFKFSLSFLSFPSFPRKMPWSSQRRLLLRSSLAGKPSYSLYCQEVYSLETCSMWTCSFDLTYYQQNKLLCCLLGLSGTHNSVDIEICIVHWHLLTPFDASRRWHEGVRRCPRPRQRIVDARDQRDLEVGCVEVGNT